MNEVGHPLTMGGRVNEGQLVRVDAAALLKGQPRAHFIVEATLEKADEILREAAAEAPVLAEGTA